VELGDDRERERYERERDGLERLHHLLLPGAGAEREE
jgi:hypothetical protein